VVVASVGINVVNERSVVWIVNEALPDKPMDFQITTLSMMLNADNMVTSIID